MTAPVLGSEPLNGVLEGREAGADALCDMFTDALGDPTELYAAAAILRKRNKGTTVTFSKKAFFNLVNLCRDTCSYCTYKAEPGDAKLSMMSIRDVKKLLDMARRYGCVEALFVTGERPEQEYGEARRWLAENGFSSTAEYIMHCSETALEHGMYPHTNAGNLTTSEMRDLARTNMSMGLMLESSSMRLCGEGMPHERAPSKHPQARIGILRNAGRLGIPMTTGLLVGIGETPVEMIHSILEIRALHHTHANIQEIILQNFQPKSDTVMAPAPAPDENYFKIMVALTRIAMPQMNIQIPPNLSPHSYGGFLDAGINDWGGISPLTPDHVNPEFSWPAIAGIESYCGGAGLELQCRFPAYPEFFHMIPGRLRRAVRAESDGRGYVSEDRWR